MKRPRTIPPEEAIAIHASYQETRSLTVTAKLFRHSVSACVNAMVRQGLHETHPKPRLTDEFVAAAYAQYTAGASLSEVSRRLQRSRRGVAEMFHRRGLKLRPCEIVMVRDGTTGRMLAAPLLTDAEIEALVEGARKMEVPKALAREWRKWPLERRRDFIDRVRAKLQPESDRPTSPFSANVQPFDYATPEAREIAARMNAGCNSRNKRVQLRFGSQGVIYDGKLWFWAPKTGYLHGRWSPEAPRPQLHHVIWQKAQGREVPADGVIRFVDGNPNNFDPANLVLATRNDLARENQAASLFRRSRERTAALLRRSQTTTTDHAHHLVSKLTRRTS